MSLVNSQTLSTDNIPTVSDKINSKFKTVDEEYMEAALAKDISKTGAMVNKAAKTTGYVKNGFH